MISAGLSGDDDVTTEMKQRIVMANKTSYALEKKKNSPNLKRQTYCKHLCLNMEVNVDAFQRWKCVPNL